MNNRDERMQLIDSHCHLDMLQLDEYDNGLSDLVLLAKQSDITNFLTISTSVKTFSKVKAIAAQFDNIHCSFGIHPHNEFQEQITIDEIVKYASEPKVVAIGETGLDYFYTNDQAENQQQNFRKHIQAANVLNKPLIVHTRQAKEDTLDILRQENADQCGGVLHCFTEGWQMAKKALDFGFYISISGIVTFKKAEEVQQVASKVPLDRLLIETDSPYLSPVPFRGKQNNPVRVRIVAEFIAKLRGISLEELAEQTTANYFDLFSGAKS